MRELLIRYLLGELDGDEKRELTAQLKSSPELRAELEQLRSCFAATQDEDLYAPDAPTGLAARTAITVANSDDAHPALRSRNGAGLSQSSDAPAGILGWSLADLTVAGGVMLAVSMLIFPALRSSRDGTRQVICQNNMHQIGLLIDVYSQNNGGFIPEVNSNQFAGIYVLRLIRGDYISADEMRKLLVCPGAPRADEFRQGTFKIYLPNSVALQKMTPQQENGFAAQASPFYAYALPYRANGKYHKIRNTHRAMSPVLSDASGSEQTNPMSQNHGGQLVQVQCEDGAVKIFPSITLPGVDDNMYRNAKGKVAAGLGPQDIVLGSSDATPGEDPADEVVKDEVVKEDVGK